MIAVNLETEYLHNPLGIDIAAPRLFWRCENGVKQTACQVICRSESGRILWDSGKVESGAMHMDYAGSALCSRSRVIWQVRLWDENGLAGQWSQEAAFELGLLHASDWTARWITGDYTVNKKRRYPVDCFRKTFSLQQVTKARLYATACGLYEAKLNGARVGDFILAPGVTDYRKRVQYQTYDVTSLLRQGENELTFQLADGWYRGSVGAWGMKNQYGTQTKLLAQLELTMADGSIKSVVTDGTWQWSNDGAIRFADNKDGEIVEAFRQPSYGGAAKETGHAVVPTASNNVPVTEHERRKPQLLRAPSGAKILDFGQNLAGYVEFSITASRGQRVFLRFAELLDEKGEFTQKNIQCKNRRITTPLQQVEYFCKDRENRYKTTFAIFGFQYVLVETDAAFSADDFTAVAVYSDLAPAGTFESSNALLNRFVDATIWSAKGNFADIPTDCPTRERHGWAGDAQIFCDSAGYLFHDLPFWRKYLNDLYDWQKPNGRLPQIAPHGGVDFYMNVMDGSVGWSDAGILIPYRLWKRYGDERILRKYYDGMKKYATFMMSRCGKWGGPYAKRLHVKGAQKRYLVNRGQSYGEWAEPKDVHEMKWYDFAQPHPEVSTAYTAYMMALMAQIAQTLRKTEDLPLFCAYRDGCKKAYQSLVQTQAFSLDTDQQARLVRPLALGLLGEAQSAYAKKRLVQALEHYGWRLGTGFLSTPLILDVLASYDLDAAYRLLENEKMPGWLFMAKNGASTIWESWEGTQAQNGIASLNHYSKGAVCEWLFKTMCGIRIDGENAFTIAPNPGGRFTYARASYESIYGVVRCGWVRTEDGCCLTLELPANTRAKVVLPDGKTHTAQPGVSQYRF